MYLRPEAILNERGNIDAEHDRNHSDTFIKVLTEPRNLTNTFFPSSSCPGVPTHNAARYPCPR